MSTLLVQISLSKIVVVLEAMVARDRMPVAESIVWLNVKERFWSFNFFSYIRLFLGPCHAMFLYMVTVRWYFHMRRFSRSMNFFPCYFLFFFFSRVVQKLALCSSTSLIRKWFNIDMKALLLHVTHSFYTICSKTSLFISADIYKKDILSFWVKTTLLPNTMKRYASYPNIDITLY